MAASTASRGRPTPISASRPASISRPGSCSSPTPPSCSTAELAAPKYRPDVVAMGTNTDPYQPVERELKITRSILKVLSDFNNPVGIVTKNHLVTRDIDILGDMAKRNLAEVFLSITTLDKDLARDMEPRASAPHRRLDAIKRAGRCRRAGRRDDRADDPGPERPRDGSDPRGGDARRAPRARASPSCACRSRSRTCSRNGCAPTGPTAPRRCCR